MTALRRNREALMGSESRYSVRTPFTNCGKADSNYGGNNQVLRGWYANKRFRGLSSGLSSKNQMDPNFEIYSQFTGKPMDLA